MKGNNLFKAYTLRLRGDKIIQQSPQCELNNVELWGGIDGDAHRPDECLEVVQLVDELVPLLMERALQNRPYRGFFSIQSPVGLWDAYFTNQEIRK